MIYSYMSELLSLYRWWREKKVVSQVPTPKRRPKIPKILISGIRYREIACTEKIYMTYTRSYTNDLHYHRKKPTLQQLDRVLGEKITW
jgi:hypothetical protein